MNGQLDQIAKPGDFDLDMDIRGLVLNNVVVMDREVLIEAAGGRGRWVSTHSGVMEGVDFVEQMSLYLQVPGHPDDVFAEFLNRLVRWRDNATPLRICAAPGRFTTLIESAACWVPLPRRNPPDTIQED